MASAWGKSWGKAWGNAWGAIGSAGRRFKYYGKAYLKRKNELLVFSSEAEKDAFLDAEEKAKTAINRAARRKVIATKPKPQIVDIEAVKQDAQRFEIKADISALEVNQDYGRLLQIYAAIVEMQDEEDIEILLTL
jgi:hypothetical protein